MSKKDLNLGYKIPEFLAQDATHEPTMHLIRAENGSVVTALGRRPSEILCVQGIRDTVNNWRENEYEGASETTKKLFHWWFEESRQTALFGDYRPYWVQREAIETLVYLLEIEGRPDAWKLIEKFGVWNSKDLIQETFSLQRTMDGEPQLNIPTSADPVKLPPDDLPRYAIKAATGSGKTMVMAHIIAWSYFHANREKGSRQANNFLILSPNVIVFERLKKDFEGGKTFADLQMAPPGWKIQIQVILRGDSIEPAGKNSLVVTNIQQLYENRVTWTPKNAVEAILGRPPVKGQNQERATIERVRGMKRLMVLNDEAHHLHDDELEWNKILLGLHEKNPLVTWLDFSATPKMQNGSVFPWVVTDYPLAQAVEQQIVKFPVVVKGIDFEDPTGVNNDNAVEKYGKWLTAGVERLRAHEKAYAGNSHNKPVMFIMCESVKHAESVGEWLSNPKSGFKFKSEEVLIIHTKDDNEGSVKQADLEILRDQANAIDSDDSPVRVVVSVLILREGWDVRNVTVVLGLRPGNARSEILPEQAVGRGLRLMPQVLGTQVLEVLGTPAFQSLVAGLEDEGVIIGVKDEGEKATPVMIAPTLSRKEYDISIPRTSSIFNRDFKKVEDLQAKEIPAIFTFEELKQGASAFQVQFETMQRQLLGVTDIMSKYKPLTNESIANITSRAIDEANLTDEFALLFPIVRNYITTYCFGRIVDIDDVLLRDFLSDSQYRLKIIAVVSKALGELTTVKNPITLQGKPIKLSEVKGFLWNRDHLNCTKTIFNWVPTWNSFESEFAKFLDACPDVDAFSALAESYTEFYVNYQKPSGALGRYFPDWVVRVGSGKKARHWIIETKGRVWEGTVEKDQAVEYWCSQVKSETNADWNYVRVNQDWWKRRNFTSFESLIYELANSNHDENTLI